MAEEPAKKLTEAVKKMKAMQEAARQAAEKAKKKKAEAKTSEE